MRLRLWIRARRRRDDGTGAGGVTTGAAAGMGGGRLRRAGVPASTQPDQPAAISASAIVMPTPRAPGGITMTLRNGALRGRLDSARAAWAPRVVE
jgi:hypothetical protein